MNETKTGSVVEANALKIVERWKADAALRAEFRDDIRTFLGYLDGVAKGRIKQPPWHSSIDDLVTVAPESEPASMSAKADAQAAMPEPMMSPENAADTFPAPALHVVQRDASEAPTVRRAEQQSEYLIDRVRKGNMTPEQYRDELKRRMSELRKVS